MLLTSIGMILFSFLGALLRRGLEDWKNTRTFSEHKRLLALSHDRLTYFQFKMSVDDPMYKRVNKLRIEIDRALRSDDLTKSY